MKAELKQKWVEALRSGEYKQQTRGVLRMDDAFCCIGVLCDIVAPHDWKGNEIRRLGEDRKFLQPCHIQAITGLDHDTAWQLAMMNDRGRSFAYIADHIETNIPAE